MAGSKTAGSFHTALNLLYADYILVDIVLIVCLVDILLLIVCLIFVCKFGN